MKSPALDEGMVLMMVATWTTQRPAPMPANDVMDAQSREAIAEQFALLENDVASSREAYQQTIEELETANEELQR